MRHFFLISTQIYEEPLYKELHKRSNLINADLGFYPDWMGLEPYSPKHIKVFFDIKVINKLEVCIENARWQAAKKLFSITPVDFDGQDLFDKLLSEQLELHNQDVCYVVTKMVSVILKAIQEICESIKIPECQSNNIS